ncbi:MAG TPA: hypothetical protein VM050_11635 [Patescibacteria group bacterium]|nr:hypothetical protein [Patescibacteria group bacterium]
MNKTKRRFALASMVLLAVTLGGIWMVYAQEQPEVPPEASEGLGPWGFRQRLNFFAQLDEETKNQLLELREAVQELKESGATIEEIREYVTAELEELGIEHPTKGEGACMGFPGGGLRQRQRLGGFNPQCSRQRFQMRALPPQNQ